MLDIKGCFLRGSPLYYKWHHDKTGVTWRRSVRSSKVRRCIHKIKYRCITNIVEPSIQQFKSCSVCLQSHEPRSLAIPSTLKWPASLHHHGMTVVFATTYFAKTDVYEHSFFELLVANITYFAKEGVYEHSSLYVGFCYLWTWHRWVGQVMRCSKGKKRGIYIYSHSRRTRPSHDTQFLTIGNIIILKSAWRQIWHTSTVCTGIWLVWWLPWGAWRAVLPKAVSHTSTHKLEIPLTHPKQ